MGDLERVAETRVEMVLPRHRRAAVVAALRAAHPYEEPAHDVLELAAVPGNRGSGRIGRLAEPLPLRAFTEQVAAALPGCGSACGWPVIPTAQVETVAVCGGAGDFLIDSARSSGADVYVTSDLRHHPASELREHAYLDPGDAGAGRRAARGRGMDLAAGAGRSASGATAHGYGGRPGVGDRDRPVDLPPADDPAAAAAR